MDDYYWTWLYFFNKFLLLDYQQKKKKKLFFQLRFNKFCSKNETNYQTFETTKLGREKRRKEKSLNVRDLSPPNVCVISYATQVQILSDCLHAREAERVSYLSERFHRTRSSRCRCRCAEYLSESLLQNYVLEVQVRGDIKQAYVETSSDFRGHVPPSTSCNYSLDVVCC